MIVTIDIGNSNVVIVVYNNKGQILYQKREETEKSNIDQIYTTYFNDIKQNVHQSCEGVVLASVVPSVTMNVLKILENVFGVKPFNIKTTNVPEFKIHLDNPNELGADFIASAYGAIAKEKVPAIIADMGSATKLSIINENQQFLGGVIIPGIGISSQALTQFIPHLPEIKLELPQCIIGHDTISSMQSGLLYGVIGSVEGIAYRIEKQLGKKHHKILTGGFANIVHQSMKDFEFEPNLVNDGLYYLFKNKKVKHEY